MIDTAQKRIAALINPSVIPLPDGTIDSGDRGILCRVYTFLTTLAPSVVGSVVMYWMRRRRR